MEEEVRSSIYVAPLHIVKSTSQSPEDAAPVVSPSDAVVDLQAALQLHWPTSARSSLAPTVVDSLEEAVPERAPFHSYIRAFFQFEPVNSLSPSTVTLPLRAGDIILVHSVAHSGWADGTKLDDGSRGNKINSDCFWGAHTDTSNRMAAHKLLRSLREPAHATSAQITDRFLGHHSY